MKKRHGIIAYLFYKRFRLQIWIWAGIIVLMYFASLFYLVVKNNEQVADIEQEKQVLKAAFIQFDEVVQFNRIFPEAAFYRSSFTATPNQDLLDPFYVCKLPKYTIEDDSVTFHGKVTITSNKIVLATNMISNETTSEMTIHELENQITNRPSK